MSIFSVVNVDGKLLEFSRPTRAFYYYHNKKRDLITGEESISSLEEIEKLLIEKDLNDSYENPHLFHCFYELGYFLSGQFEKISEDDLLLIEIKYSQSRWFEKKHFSRAGKKNLSLRELNGLKLSSYCSKFDSSYQHLLKGNCYQVNLTHRFHFSFNDKITAKDFLDCLFSGDEVGAYAHATYLGTQQKMILSNSPECLFKISKQGYYSRITTMPIKGTIAYDRDEDEIDDLWQQLSGSVKDEGELNMITDLLRNDLSKIQNPTARVIDKKNMLIVPKIMHQYSKVIVDVDNSTTLWQILSSLFPGGSVTGAPKKRVMEIIEELEDEKRGIYCGSTMIFHKSFKAASINIRTAWVDLSQNRMVYGAGGGITLLSECQKEYDELYLKLRSFVKLLDRDKK